MKLYNRTKCPDAILRPLLVAAGRAVGARTSGVVVRVTQAHHLMSSGLARQGYWLWRGTLVGFGRRDGGIRNDNRIVRTDGGWFSVTLPNRRWSNVPETDWLAYADWFYDTALHEWGHIRDYQQQNDSGVRLEHSNINSRRRPSWADRPEERRAEKYRQEAKEKLQSGQLKSRDDLILELALWLDGGERERSKMMAYKLFVSHDCGINYYPDGEGEIADLLSRGKEYDEQTLRWYIEDAEGKMVDCSRLHKEIIGAVLTYRDKQKG